MKKSNISGSARQTGLYRGSVAAGALLAAFAAGLAVPANAQTAASEEPAAVEVDDIVVTAQRREQKLIDVPISVSVQSGAALARNGVFDSKALDQLSASVTFADNYSATASSVILRGTSSVANDGGIQPSTAVVIDGIPVARQAEFIADFSDVERVEVLGGPQGTLFGKNSSAGVINIVTKRPVFKFEGLVDFGLTSDGELSTKGTINVPFSENRGAFRLNAFYRDQKPILKNYGGPDALGREAWGVQGKLLYEFSDKFDALVSAGYSRSNSSYGQSEIILPISSGYTDLQKFLLGPSIGRGADSINQNTPALDILRAGFVTAELTWKPTDELSVISLTGYRDVKDQYDQDTDAMPVGVEQGVGFINLGANLNGQYWPVMFVGDGKDRGPTNWHYFSQELRATYQGERLTVVGGLYYQDYRETAGGNTKLVYDGAFVGDASGVLYFNGFQTDSKLKDETAAIFGDVTYKLTDKFSVFGGLRQTREKITFDYVSSEWFAPMGLNVDGVYDANGTTVFNPVTYEIGVAPNSTRTINAKDTTNNTSGRVGVMFKPSSNESFYGSFNRGYKGAAVNKSSYSGVGTTLAVLKPEISTSYEIGTKLNLFDRRVNVSLAAYNQKIKDIQQSTVIPGTAFTSLLNAGDLKVKGVEFEMQAKITPALRFDGSLAYTDAKYKGGLYLCNGLQTPGVAPCTVDSDEDGTPDSQDLTGSRAMGSPKWKIVAGPTYTFNVSDAWEVSLNASLNWRTSIQWQLGRDPRTQEPKHAFLNASINLHSEDGWNILIYGKNLTNEFYYSNIAGADFFIGAAIGNLSRDYKRYVGMAVTKSF